MSMGGMGLNVDRISVIIDALSKDDPERFRLSCLKFKNARGIKAVFELGRLKSELLDAAKDPNMAQDALGPPPREPKIVENMDEDQKNQLEFEYREQLKEY